MVHLKDTVRTGNMTLQLLDGLLAAAHVYANLGYIMVVTSLDDSTHGQGSKHPEGNAADLRLWMIPEKERPKVMRHLTQVLGGDWDVVHESDHFHIEYDKKRK